MFTFMVLVSIFLGVGSFLGSVIVNKEPLSEAIVNALRILIFCLLLTLATWLKYGE